MDHDAIYRAYPDCKRIDDALGAFKADGSKIDFVQSDIDAARTTLNSEAAAVQYKFQRKEEYPEIGEQLDMLYHAIDNDSDLKGKFSNFYNTIKSIKEKYPKPS